jgi:hypothetical protein
MSQRVGTSHRVFSRAAAQMRRNVILFVLIQGLGGSTYAAEPSVIIQWNTAVLQAVRKTTMGTPMAARALAMVYTCMYDSWAAYDDKAIGTQLSGALRRPPSERTLANKERAIGYAAYRALSDVLPADIESVYKPLMKELGYDPNNNSTDIETPEGIGNVACTAVLEFRHHDKSNQLGDMQRLDKQDRSLVAGTLSSYGDWTGYTSLNPPGTLPARATYTKPLNPDHWQPLTYIDSSGNLVVQMFQSAQWPFVTPFALTTGDELRAFATSCSALSPKEAGALAPTQPSQGKRALAPEETSSHPCGPAKYGTSAYQSQAEELITLSANLTDEQKMIVEFWTTRPDSDCPVAQWMRFAEFVSGRDHLDLDTQVKLFFVLSNAMMDADIAAWDAKRAYDSVRPATAIPLLFRGKQIKMWAGPGENATVADGGNWIPYQPTTLPTPPSPEYVSETSAESASAARILSLITGSDHFGYSATLPVGSSRIERSVTPAQPVTLKWERFTEAADQAGLAGRYAGIHFVLADTMGRKLGRVVAERVWARAQSYFDGTNTSPAPTYQLPAAN